MLKAVFTDYNGTIIREGGKEMEEIIARICRHSDIHTPGEALAYWYKKLGAMEKKCCGDSFISEEEIVKILLEQCRTEIHLEENLEELQELFRLYWANAPVYADAAEFLKTCPIPVYVLTNNGVPYVKHCLSRNGLKPAGIITADMTRAYKPHREVFLKALEVSGCAAGEVIHVGDSPESDVKGAQSAGIVPVLVDRKGKYDGADCAVIKLLTDLLAPSGELMIPAP